MKAFRERIVVTGMGSMTPFGIGNEMFWEGMVHSCSAISTITRFNTEGFSTTIAGQVPEVQFQDFLEPKELKTMDRCTHFAIAASQIALEQAGIEFNEEKRDRTGVIIGSGMGGMETIENEIRELHTRGQRKVSAFAVPKTNASSPASMVSIKHGFRGPVFAIQAACASGNFAIIEGIRCLQLEEADVVLVGGTEAAVTPAGMAGYCSMRALSRRNQEPEKASRPFDKDRDGFVMSEGGSVLVLETLAHAQKRKAVILGEIIGYGVSSDAHHIAIPEPSGIMAARAMLQAIQIAKCSLEDIDYINAHGTSTDFNDVSETHAIKLAFGDLAKRIPISSIKSMIGHQVGASGATQAVASLLMIQHQTIAPTLNLDNPDPRCDLDYVPHTPREAKLVRVLSNSFGFGGLNSTILFQKFLD
ncbi:MAG: beta-ketoacyl-ACP synthase II [Planctomycetota bacterium]